MAIFYDTVSNAADQERAMVEVMIPTVNEFHAANVGSDLQVISTDHYGQLNDPNGQTSQFLSSLTSTVALDVISESDKGKGQQLIPAVNDKGNNEVLVSDVDQERAKDEMMIHTISKLQAANVGSDIHVVSRDQYGQFINTSGQSNCTVALDAIDESDKGSSQQLGHAVIDKGNTEFQVNLKGDATVTQAADQDSAMDEVMIPTVYGQLIDHSGQPNQMLSSLNSTVALQVIPDFDKRNAQELRHAGIPAVTVNSELLVNMKDAATVSQPADPGRAKQTNTVALDTIAEDKQSSSHHEKAVAINREHTEVYLQPKENLSVSNTPFVPKNTGQQIYDQVTSENAANQQKTRHPKEDTDQNARSQQNKNNFHQRAAEQEAKHVGKAAGRGIQKVRRYPPISTSIYRGEEIFPIETVKQSTTTKLQHTAANKAGNNTASNNLVKEYGEKEELSWDAVFSSLNSNASLFDTRNNAKAEHCQRDRSWDGRVIEDVNIRRPPMRKAKQKQVDQKILSKSKNKV